MFGLVNPVPIKVVTYRCIHIFVFQMMDMFFFMFLLSIWVVAYGVAKQGILIHNDNRLDWILRGAVYEPYLIIFGDFPQNIECEWRWKMLYIVLCGLKKCLNDHFRVYLSLWKPSSPATDSGFDLNSCSMNGTDPLKPKCPVLNESQTPAFPEWLTIIMLCVYLLFANILLLNLLIAIFKWVFLLHTFVSEESPELRSLSSLCLSLFLLPALRSRKFRTTQTESGSFKDTSWLRSTTAAPLRLLLSSSSAIFTSSSGTWCCAGPPSSAKSSVSIQLHGYMQHES